MRERRIEIWDLFTGRVINSSARAGVTVLWRGQSNPAWPLASSFERRALSLWGVGKNGPILPPYDEHPTDLEREQIAKKRADLRAVFLQALMGVAGAPAKRPSNEEIWALGRHYGLATPFLDWTLNPYFAAFFALTGTPVGTTDVAVYRLEYDQRLRNAGLRLQDDIWLPELHRMHRQQGVFTQIDDNDRTFEVEGLCLQAGAPDALERFVIDRRIAGEALADLRAHGLDYNIIYPDLEGVARFANSQVFGD